MKKLKEGDLDGLEGFWHEDFLGWPSHSAEPVGRSESRASVENLLQRLRIVNFELQPRAIHPRRRPRGGSLRRGLTVVGNGGAPETTAYRLTHTWVKHDGVWKILGGMSAKVDIE